jgi:hypothetical protein
MPFCGYFVLFPFLFPLFLVIPCFAQSLILSFVCWTDFSCWNLIFRKNLSFCFVLHSMLEWRMNKVVPVFLFFSLPFYIDSFSHYETG